MPYTVKFNDTKQINKNFYQAVLEGVYIGKIFNLKIRDYPVFLTIKNVFKYALKKQTLANLSETELRRVGGYTIVNNKLIKHFKLMIPYCVNASEMEQERIYDEYSKFVEHISIFKEFDLFYYDRDEQISDYQLYFNALDNKIAETATFNTPEGKELSLRIRSEMEEYLQEIFDTYTSRSREAFAVISVDITGNKISDLEAAIDELDSKIFKIVAIFSEMKIQNYEVEGKDQEWLFNNFISLTTNY